MVLIIGAWNNEKDVDVVPINKVVYLFTFIIVGAKQAAKPFANVGAGCIVFPASLGLY